MDEGAGISIDDDGLPRGVPEAGKPNPKRTTCECLQLVRSCQRLDCQVLLPLDNRWSHRSLLSARARSSRLLTLWQERISLAWSASTRAPDAMGA